MILCAPCEQIMKIRLKQRKDFLLDLCPDCRERVRQAFKMAKTG